MALPSWMASHRISLPPRSSGFFHRRALANACRPIARRLTLLIAPGGFGKTTLLAECCRDLHELGVPTAWLTLDGQDEPDELDAYVAYAFQYAGFDLRQPLRTAELDASQPYPRTAFLLRAIEGRGDPFVLALDEAERLGNPALVDLLNHLLIAAPPNLHIAIAARQLPTAFDLVTPMRGVDPGILTAEDLRFSREDIARFFEDKLSRRNLADVASTSAGWPIALRIRRNEQPGGGAKGDVRIRRDAVRNWVAARFWYNFADAEKEFLLDVGLFDWFDGVLLKDVLGDPRAMEQLESLGSLDGLLRPIGGGEAPAWQLHPLIRDHCAEQRLRESPARYRSVHGRIARALAARDLTVEAMRHAIEAEDTELVSTILVDAGGVRLCLREGYAQLVAADHLVPNDALARHPRLVPARCAALAASGRLAEARTLYARIPPISPDLDGDKRDLFFDRCLARAIVADFGLESAHSEESRTVLRHATRLAEIPDDVRAQAAIEFLLCVYWNMHGDFDKAAFHGRRTDSFVEGRDRGLAPAIAIQFGLMAMVQGRVADAVARYRDGLRFAKADFLRTPKLTLKAGLLIRELDLERNRFDPAIPAPSVPGDLCDGAGLNAYFAATDLAVESVLVERGPDEALLALDAMRSHPQHADLPAWGRHLAAMRVSLLADSDRVDQAAQTWAMAGLPTDDAGCVDLTDQSWRELESLCCARLRLMMASGGYDAARRFSDAVLSVTEERSLIRTAMRIRILAMRLEHRAGAENTALAHLAAYLRLFDETDYARSLVRENDLATAMLHRYLAGNADASGRAAAERLLDAVNDGSTVTVPQLTDREADVLLKLLDRRDNEIAAELGITHPGVRHHVQNIFRKLGVHTRRDATRRAAELGILPLATD